MGETGKMKNNLDILKECEGAERIGISGHVRPDGDCVGACLALYLYLKKCLPEVFVKVNLEEPAPIFKELKGFDEIDSTFGEEEAYDVYFLLDTVPDRLGDAQKYYEKAGKRINIDHHVSNTGAGDISLVRPDIGSVCEVMYDLFEKDRMDKDIAMCIYIGMIHDTGVFQYSNTKPDTLRKAAQLLEFGFDFPRLIEETFYQRTFIQSQILGRALMESIRFMSGRCIVTAIDRKTMGFYNATPKDFDGIVNQLRNIKGIDCAIFMYETDTQEYKVSLRTSSKVDAAKVATYFGGGGHVRAAGCTMHGTFYDCVNNLSCQIEQQLLQNEQ